MPRQPARDDEVLAMWQVLGDQPSEIARRLGLHNTTVQYYIRKLGLRTGIPSANPSRATPPDQAEAAPPAAGVVKGLSAKPAPNCNCFILTSAQNNTYLHDGFWENLLAYADARNAQILVGTYSYNKTAYGQMSIKRTAEQDVDRGAWYDPRLDGYFADERIQLAPGLVWAGEQNIMPTAVRPLSGLENYTRQDSGIFPHAKMQMKSEARNANNPQAKFNYTTGTVTLRNYIQKKAGLRADYHHVYGALIVEVTDDRRWFVRQINAEEDGTFYDLDHRVKGGSVEKGHWVEAINWGDIHAIHLDPVVQQMCWAKDGMLDALRPKYQFLHDILDFYSRNHWDIGNHHRMYERFVEGRDSVHGEVKGVALFLRNAARDWCQSIVVDSNHDNALERWLRDADFKKDPMNAIFYLESQLALYRAKEAMNDRFHLLEWAVNREPEAPRVVRFLRQDESFTICNGEIECGMHGHLGPNSSRGTPASLARLGAKANTGHTHSAEIFEGMYVAGLSADLNPHYASGPHSRSHSHIVTYENAKRAIITSSGSGWRA